MSNLKEDYIAKFCYKCKRRGAISDFSDKVYRPPLSSNEIVLPITHCYFKNGKPLTGNLVDCKNFKKITNTVIFQCRVLRLYVLSDQYTNITYINK